MVYENKYYDLNMYDKSRLTNILYVIYHMKTISLCIRSPWYFNKKEFNFSLYQLPSLKICVFCVKTGYFPIVTILYVITILL